MLRKEENVSKWIAKELKKEMKNVGDKGFWETLRESWSKESKNEKDGDDDGNKKSSSYPNPDPATGASMLTPGSVPGGKLNLNQLVHLAKAAGANDNEAIRLASIAMYESGGNSNAHNPKYPDNSYGLWQVNMLDEPGYLLGEERRNRYNLTNNEQLWDPATNAKVALDILRTSGWSAWSTDKLVTQKDLDAAKKALNEPPPQSYKTTSENSTSPASTKGTRAGSASISSQMGYRDLAKSPGYHMGLDVTGQPLGSELLAFNDATINTVGTMGQSSGYGNYIGFVDNASGIANFYAHMRQNMSNKFSKGQKVKAGTSLGIQGNTGRSTGEHLHWETSMNPDGTGMPKSEIKGSGVNAKEVGAWGRFNPLSRYSIGTPFGFHKGGMVPGRGERMARLLGGEMVIDVDSAGPAKDMLLAINQASGRYGVMKAIRDYAPYEAIQSRMIPVPVEKMVPVPVPMPSNSGGVVAIPVGRGVDTSSLAAIG